MPSSDGLGDPDFEQMRWQSSAELEYAASHVFLPAHRGYNIPNHVEGTSLACAAYHAAHAYSEIVDDTLKPQWCRIIKMLNFLHAFLLPGSLASNQVVSQLREMQTGDTLVLLNKAQDTAVIVTKHDHCALYEVFRTSRAESEGLYRECAIEIPDEVFLDQFFQIELADFLLYLDGFPSHRNCSQDIPPRPIRLLTSILRGAGRGTEVPHAIERANSHYKLGIWHRSPLWLLIKLAIQMSLHGGLESVCYKTFLLCFMCNLAKDTMEAKLSSHLLHAISVKILRRFKKLGSSAPYWLRDNVVKVSVSLRETLEARWKEIEAVQRSSSLWAPSLLDLDGDTQLSLLRSKGYINKYVTNFYPPHNASPFSPKYLPRGILNDFLASNGLFFEEAYLADPYVTLYDVERAIEQGIDDWVTRVTDVDQACVQLATLMDKYLSSAQSTYKNNPNHLSIMFLTMIELWVALDGLVIGVAPMLVSYFPGIPIALQNPLFHKTMNFHRLHRAYQYLSARQPQSHHHQSVFLPRNSWGYNARSLYDVNSPHFWCLVEKFGMPSRVDIVLPGLECPLLTLLRTFREETFVCDFAYRLPSSRQLDQYIRATSHSSNGVLAAQEECPDDLSPHEFIAFGHLRSGGTLQWVNVLRELRSRTLNFRRRDVYLLLTQTTSQVDLVNLDKGECDWNQELQESSFCNTLLDELKCLLVDVAIRSLDGVLMATISFLLTRLLASSPCEDVSQRAIGLLQCIRRKTFKWVKELSCNSMMAWTKTEQSEPLRDMAATCRSTFDVGPELVHKVLRSAEDVDALLFCAILIHANTPVDLQSISEHSRLLLERDRRLSLALESALRDVILADGSNRGIDLAVRNIWPGYLASPRRWEALPSPNSHWLTCETGASEDRRSQSVHLNLLDGMLLVDGKPIDGLPREIRKKSTYKRIFGDQHFLAIASDLPGMDFSSMNMISDHRVHFALQGDNLVIRAQHKDMINTLEVIPHTTLNGDLPARFIEGHVHFLNLSTSIIEIRPFGKIWEESSDNWKIDCSSWPYHMYNGHERIVDMRSKTCKMVSTCFECLDTPENLIITTHPTDAPQSSPTRRLSVVLPRYGLSFFVNKDGELESRDFKNMVYDRNQCIGTLFGLEDRLVLHPKIRVEEPIPRCVIIPDGQISREESTDHVDVWIDSDPTQPVTYHTYHVDIELGCLTGYSSWRSKVYLAILHAETSVDWMPDPLTARTGIEEALCLLQSSGCRSIMELDTRHGAANLPSSVDHDMYPQIKFALQQIQHLIMRDEFLRGHKHASLQQPKLDAIGALRTAYLFPSGVVVGPIPKSTNVKLPKFKFSEREDFAHTVSLAVYNWFINKENGIGSGDDATHTLAETPAWANPHAWTNSNLVPLSIAEVEGRLQESTEARQRFRMLFLLPTIVYNQTKPQPHLLSILVALAKQFPLDNPPRYDQCRPLDGFSPSRDVLKNCLTDVDIPWHAYDNVVDGLLRAWPPQPGSAILQIDHSYHLVELDTLLSRLLPRYSYSRRLSVELETVLSNCYCNFKLKEDLTHRLAELKTKLHALPNTAHPSRHTSDVPFEAHSRIPWRVTLEQLLRDRSPPNIPLPIPFKRQCGFEGNGLASAESDFNTCALNEFLTSFWMNKTDSPFQQQYIRRLHDSAQHVGEAKCITRGAAGRPSIEELEKHYVQCKVNYGSALNILKRELGPMDDALEQVLHRSGQWPHIAADTLFRSLASTSPIKLPDGWKQCVVSLALLLVELQRARRLLSLENLEEEFSREVENKGCDGWRAEDYPDWLLIQLQGNFLIRWTQADVAMNMTSPPFGGNTAMQVNMGEGKSSVIVPISATTLADGNQLVRVVVPKALTVQMFRLLVCRLGGFVNRPIYHLPFSRSITGRYSERQLSILRDLLSECVRNRGILVVQPEHILSCKLTSVEGQLRKHLGGTFLELQKWINRYARDILDESDEVLHPRFQVIYTVGSQRDIEGYPDRWTITQQVLRLVKKRVVSLSSTFPNAIEYERTPSGSFPHIRISRASDAHQLLTSLIVDDVMDGRLPCISFRDIGGDQQLRDAVRDFISSREVFKQTARMVEEYARKTNLWDGILLLRGLFACDILLFALAERRWRVDYGLAPHRTMLAVPYQAKDVPAPAAEFGHPDITIVLTCLSYYYDGLNDEQLRASLKLLQEQDDPSMEYSNWLRDHNPDVVPGCIQDLNNVNIKSSEQWEKYLFPLFPRNQGAVDFYLSQIVFPKEAKEFSWKIVASSWDLAEKRDLVVTGFSGTNDSRYLLPMPIVQHDLVHQLGTNARVLSHLLQPENNFYMLISDTNGERRTTLDLLNLVADQVPEIRVFLDVGAQVLDLSNYEVAKTWLEISPNSHGAVYFNDDEPMVLTKDGTSRYLMSSPLAQRLDRCVVYLDDAHTRGTDLKFPSGCRAAVTLGPKMTKDRLAQGCMRMRKLGHGHPVMFLAPLEVDRSIRAVAAKEGPNIPLTSIDVLRWSIHEAWADIRRRAPYWAQQGIDHSSRYHAWTCFCKSELTPEQLADAWLQPELKSLADLYAPFQPQNAPDRSSIDNYPEIQQRCINLGAVKLPEAQMEEEQEREVNREVEREREVQRRQPHKAKPAEHFLHPDVVDFVKTGVFPPSHTTGAFHPVFTIEGSSTATSNASVWSPFVLATSDFCKTTERTARQEEVDQFLRPVQWILSGKWNHDRVLVLLSPFEADRLMPDIRVSKYVHLHVYTPRTSERMRPVDDLMFYSIPPLPDNWTPPWDLIDQLNVFAGQLYLRDYESYLRLRGLLGIQDRDPSENAGMATVRHNPAPTPGVLQEIGDTFSDSPLTLVMKLLFIRRKGLPFAETHIGRILQGQKLTEKDFDKVVWGKSSHNATARDARMLHGVTLAPTMQDDLVSSTPPQSLKRGLQMVDACDQDSRRPQKRLRA